MRRISRGPLAALLAALSALWLSGCASQFGQTEAEKTAAHVAQRNCLIRAMYFESNRSSKDGLLAVGTVVMNRVKSPTYPNTVCEVVSQPHQFAPGVMTRELDPKQMGLATKTADDVLDGKRSKAVGDAMYFHVAGLKIPYRVRYVTVAGGNAFYVKLPRRHHLFKRKDIEVASAADAEEAAAEAAAAKTRTSWSSSSKIASSKSSSKATATKTASKTAHTKPPASVAAATQATTANKPTGAGTQLASTAPLPVQTFSGSAVSVVAKSSCQPEFALGLENAALRCGVGANDGNH